MSNAAVAVVAVVDRIVAVAVAAVDRIVAVAVVDRRIAAVLAPAAGIVAEAIGTAAALVRTETAPATARLNAYALEASSGFGRRATSLWLVLRRPRSSVVERIAVLYAPSRPFASLHPQIHRTRLGRADYSCR